MKVEPDLHSDPVAVISDFLESVINNDSAEFYAQIQADSLFLNLKKQGIFRPQFSPSRLHIVYFSLFGNLIFSPKSDLNTRNHLASFQVELIRRSEKAIWYEVAWSWIRRGAETSNGEITQIFKLISTNGNDEWRISNATLQSGL